MAITRTETQVTWPTAANSVSVAAGGNATSEEVNLDATCVNAQISLKANNNGAPALDDQIYVWLLQTSGDPDGAVADEFDTTGSPDWFVILDTNIENPVIKTVELPLPQKGLKLYAEGATAGTTNAVTVSATITEQRAA